MSDFQAATVGRTASRDEIVNTLHDFGLALIPDYLSGPALAALGREFDDFFSTTSATGGRALIERDEGLTLPVVRKQMDEAAFPATAEIFGASHLREVAELYLDTPDIGFNHQIYVNKNRGTDQPIDELPFLPHFDKINTLKFFIYLTDTNAENGAMKAALGTHKDNRAARERADKAGGDTKGIDNVFLESRPPAVEAPAGAMFVFDTDITHAAGYVRSGRERRIMRGHTRTMDVLRRHRLDQEAM